MDTLVLQSSHRPPCSVESGSLVELTHAERQVVMSWGVVDTQRVRGRDVCTELWGPACSCLSLLPLAVERYLKRVM